MDQFEGLTKKERKSLKRELDQQAFEKQELIGKVRRYLVILLVIVFLGGGIFWFIAKETAPKPGVAIRDMGRDHVPDEAKVEYNSNPPSSGPHNAAWEKAGIYDEPLNDRKLVHSLEHGYVIISYNCDYKKETEKIATESSGVVNLWKNDADCQNLITNLTNLSNKKRLRKLIAVPRPNLDDRIALTAWARLDKFYDFDEKRISDFIDAFRNRGPEQTME